ncbi:MAG: hypothetical protein LBE36_02615, partial [Flavobacteriaceae bacterium]|jgi:hypothetical protein|nr:hypothetical protein [Flavobacteriaceae bacterium]
VEFEKNHGRIAGNFFAFYFSPALFRKIFRVARRGVGFLRIDYLNALIFSVFCSFALKQKNQKFKAWKLG